MSTDLLFIYLVFFVLVGWTLLKSETRKRAFRRSFTQWQIDLIGLTMHGTVVPVFQTFVVMAALSYLFPRGRGFLNIAPVISFVLNFVVLDYLYYWNHRWLHNSAAWRFHSLHHSGETFDVFTTSRNSLLTSFLTLYVWVNGIMLFALADPTPYLWGIALSNGLDLLRHMRIRRWPALLPFRSIISPKDHCWHHSRDKFGVNYGGNFSLWDRLHGTYHAAETLPDRIGTPLKETNPWTAFLRGSP